MECVDLMTGSNALRRTTAGPDLQPVDRLPEPSSAVGLYCAQAQNNEIAKQVKITYFYLVRCFRFMCYTYSATIILLTIYIRQPFSDLE